MNMPISIKNPQVENLARALAAETGEGLTTTIRRALEQRMERVRGLRRAPTSLETVLEISRRCSQLPDLDTRPADEILGYDSRGTFD